MTNIDFIQCDVLIIGGGPAGLSTSIHLAKIFKKNEIEKRILVIEKGSQIGNHILSGAIIKPQVFNELLPDIPYNELPFNSDVKEDDTYFLFEKSSVKSPIHIPYMNNKGNFIGSLGKICRFLAEKAEEFGVEVYPGFAVDEILYENDKIVGAKTKDTGVDHNGKQMENFQPGTNIYAKVTVFAEGSRGSLTKQLINKFNLYKDNNPQIYSLGIKELWEIPENNFKKGKIIHTMGYPLQSDEFGGGFIYGMENNRIALGLVVGLDVKDPTFDVHAAFQIWKTHPLISKILKGGKLLEFGAKTLPEGGLYSIPKLTVDNALIVGDSAGFVAMPALKGIHLAIKSGILAAETILKAFQNNDFSENCLIEYDQKVKESFIYKELYPVRNFRQAFNKGLLLGGLQFGTQIVTNGAGFLGKLKLHPDNQTMKKLSEYKGTLFKDRFKNKFEYDKILTYDKVTDVFYSGAKHDEHQIVHLHVNNPSSFHDKNIEEYGLPCQHFCPADVYELHSDKKGNSELRIHAENCLHCKTCDIKSPNDGITWNVPYGGNGPEYENM